MFGLCTEMLLMMLWVVGGARALICNQGTAQTLLTDALNCTVNGAYGQDACIAGQFYTPLVNGGTGTDFYACGNCTVFQALGSSPGGFLANVTCCSSADQCQTIAPPPAPTSCDALPDESGCIARQDCYWCGAPNLLGFGLCQSYTGLAFPGGQQLPPYALLLAAPPPVCGYVAWQPYQPAYAVQQLTLAFLEAYGFPPVGANLTVAAGLALDVLARSAQTRVMNDTERFCQVDDALRDWCGVNTWTPFKYCLVAETWPQADVWGWLQNTTFTSAAPSLNPIYPAFCACPVAGRAYYLPQRIIDSRQHYVQPCQVEITLLALYVVLIVVATGVLLLVLWDTAFHLIFVFQRKKRLTLGSAFASKVLLVVYLLVAIPAMVVFAVPPRGNNALFIVSGILNILAIVLIYYAFAQAIFCFMGAKQLQVQLFGASRFHAALGVFKWVFFAVTGVLSLTMVALVSALSYYTQQLVEFRVANLTQLAHLSTDVTAPMTRALVLLIMVTQLATWVIAAVLLALVGVFLGRLKKLGKINELIVRYVGLLMALVAAVPEFALVVVICYFGWIAYTPEGSAWDSFYRTNQASAWFQWALFLSQLLWLCTIAYAMRTNVKRSWLVRHVYRLMSAATHGSSANTGGSGVSSDTGHSDADTAVEEPTFRDDDD